MSLTTILITGVVLTVIFHFIGVYSGAKKFVWIALVLIWAGAISIARSEVKQKGYDYLTSIKGEFSQTDELIDDAMPEVSIYEMITIKNSYMHEKHKKND